MQLQFVPFWIENICILLPLAASLWMMLAWRNLWSGNFLLSGGNVKSQQSAKRQAKKEKGKKNNLITGQAWLSKGEKSPCEWSYFLPNLQFCLTFLEICGMFLERILDVFGYDFESSPLRIFWSLSQTNLEGIIFMVQYNSKKALLKVLSLLYAIYKKNTFFV